MNDQHARADRGNRAEQALTEFLDPAFEVVIGEYMKRLAEIAAKEPWETGKISKLAVAARIAEEVRGQILAVVLDGKEATESIKRTRQIEQIPVERRKILGIGIPT